MISPLQQTINSSIQVALVYDGYRNIAFMVLAAIFLLIVLIMMIGFIREKPKVPKGCNLTSTVLYVILYLIGIILLVITVITSTGEICKLIN
jgi:hypothetical protein